MQLCIGAAQGPYARGSQMRKLLLVFALCAIGAGCSSPVVAVEEPIEDLTLAKNGWGCPDPPEASPDPNTMAYQFWLLCNGGG